MKSATKKTKRIAPERAAADKIADIAMEHLQALPQRERDARLAAFSDFMKDVRAPRAKHSKPPKSAATRH